MTLSDSFLRQMMVPPQLLNKNTKNTKNTINNENGNNNNKRNEELLQVEGNLQDKQTDKVTTGSPKRSPAVSTPFGVTQEGSSQLRSFYFMISTVYSHVTSTFYISMISDSFFSVISSSYFHDLHFLQYFPLQLRRSTVG